jgi:phosphoribosyl-AMP cyclohydrolase / phosphoribosyl-ATP pyrophosphohydrolase
MSDMTRKPEGGFSAKNSTEDSIKNIFDPDSGLIPAIIQDYGTGKVLMLAYMNRQSLEKSLETGTTWFFSRSRNRLWNKGETSGNKQSIKEIMYDCDSDALLIKVIQSGVACHTGNESCFFNDLSGTREEVGSKLNTLRFRDLFVDLNNNREKEGHGLDVLDELYSTVCERIETGAESSYTYMLHKKGLDEILKKIGEESIEIILSSKHQSNDRTISEIADLLYHLVVLMSEKKISLGDINEELKKRRK